MSQSKSLQEYDVQIYAVVRIKVSGVPASSHSDAARIAENGIDIDKIIDHNQSQLSNDLKVEHVEYADDIESFVVEETGGSSKTLNNQYHIQGNGITKPDFYFGDRR